MSFGTFFFFNETKRANDNRRRGGLRFEEVRDVYRNATTRHSSPVELFVWQDMFITWEETRKKYVSLLRTADQNDVIGVYPLMAFKRLILKATMMLTVMMLRSADNMKTRRRWRRIWRTNQERSAYFFVKIKFANWMIQEFCGMQFERRYSNRIV